MSGSCLYAYIIAHGGQKSERKRRAEKYVSGSVGAQENRAFRPENDRDYAREMHSARIL